MKCHVYSSTDCSKLLHIEDREPTCGEDFCESCGDCLSCYGGHECTESSDGEHWWVESEQEAQDQ